MPYRGARPQFARGSGFVVARFRTCSTKRGGGCRRTKSEAPRMSCTIHCHTVCSSMDLLGWGWGWEWCDIVRKMHFPPTYHIYDTLSLTNARWACIVWHSHILSESAKYSREIFTSFLLPMSRGIFIPRSHNPPRQYVDWPQVPTKCCAFEGKITALSGCLPRPHLLRERQFPP